MNGDDLQDRLAMLLVFKLDGESFALGVESVHEILDPMEATPVPNADPFAFGLINVRGVVVPVIDVRRRLRMAPSPDVNTVRIIVLEHSIDGVLVKIAFWADVVETVISADLREIERVPDLGASWPPIYLKGVVRWNESLLVLLDADMLFAPSVKLLSERAPG